MGNGGGTDREGGGSEECEARTAPTVTCSSARGDVSAPARRAGPCGLRVDTAGSINDENVFLKHLSRASSTGAPPAPPGKTVLYRVPRADEMDDGEKKLLKCGGRTVAVFRLEDGWAAIDNACYHHGGPLYMGDIEEYDGETCVVCPWHCTKISLTTGVSLYEKFDKATWAHAPSVNANGPQQRVHEVLEMGGHVLVKLNEAAEEYASDRYAVADITSNNEKDHDYEFAQAETSHEMQEALQKRKQLRRQRELEKKRKASQPTRVPAGRLTPRATDGRPFRPSWVRDATLPPEPGAEEGSDEDWAPAYDLAEEFADLDAQYERRKEESDRLLDDEKPQPGSSS
eukprot:TRINITY_DN3843_c0_g1_i1.p1 TRINITY_DN3843_c0_g1~~TRINITY_DN3843_c0_g1_i1.p1  ORF type:complete len:343 (+),score=117.45 TRINITY_DN3843_c0_g1_i1:145-1173(+)